MMGILDEVFGSGVSDVSGATLQIVSTHSHPVENEYGLSGNTCHSRTKCHSPEPAEHPISSAEIPKAIAQLHRCGTCQHFERDSINPEYGLGDCQAFLLPDGKRHAVRYPMQYPKSETCFGPANDLARK